MYTLSDPSIRVQCHSVLRNGLSSIKDYYNSINSMIDSYISKKQNVLIHCVYGVTRSCSCDIGYCFWMDHCSYYDAYNLVKSKRLECDIPFTYENYLREYSRQYLDGIVDASIDRACSNHVVRILCGTGTTPSLLKQLREFEESHPYCRFGSQMDSDLVYSAKCFSVGSFIRDDVDLEDFTEELTPFLSQFEVYSISVD